MYSHYNICNIPIYFCNIHIKHLQHAYETPETLKTYSYNMRFSAQHLLAAWANRGSSTQSSMSWRSPVQISLVARISVAQSSPTTRGLLAAAHAELSGAELSGVVEAGEEACELWWG
jgi:hypothetical protein